MYLKEQIILGIEGGGNAISVGVMRQGKPIGHIFLNHGKNSSETLLFSIDQLLSNLEVAKTDLQGICVNQGPGSFTSIRISIATAEAIGMALNIPVYGVNNIILIASTIPYYPAPVRVIQDAYKGEFFYCSFDLTGLSPKPLEDIRLITPDDFFQLLQPNDLILGNGIDRLFKLGFDPAEKEVRWDSSYHRQASGINAIEYFLEETAKDPSPIPLDPIYIRDSDAQLNYTKNFKK